MVALQSLILGVYAITEAAGESTALLVGGAALVAKALVLPALLLVVVTRTREARLIASERHPLARLALTVAVALGAIALVPRFGLTDPNVEHAAVALVAIGITTAVVRPQAIFQALGFLVAENGLYLAAALGARRTTRVHRARAGVRPRRPRDGGRSLQREDPRGARHRRHLAARRPA